MQGRKESRHSSNSGVASASYVLKVSWVWDVWEFCILRYRSEMSEGYAIERKVRSCWILGCDPVEFQGVVLLDFRIRCCWSSGCDPVQFQVEDLSNFRMRSCWMSGSCPVEFQGMVLPNFSMRSCWSSGCGPVKFQTGCRSLAVTTPNVYRIPDCEYVSFPTVDWFCRIYDCGSVVFSVCGCAVYRIVFLPHFRLQICLFPTIVLQYFWRILHNGSAVFQTAVLSYLRASARTCSDHS